MLSSYPSKRKIVLCCLVCSVSLFFFVNMSTNVFEKCSECWQFSQEIVQIKRKNLLQQKCSDTTAGQINKSNPQLVSSVRFKLEDKHRVMYCDVPKVASTNLKALMLILSGIVKSENFSSIPRLTVHEQNPMRIVYANHLNDTIRNGLDKFIKLIFVRHPFERLVSAYRDKLISNDSFYQKAIGREIIYKYRNNPNPLSLQMGHDVTFSEFVNFIVDEWKSGKRPLDVHWRPVIDLCLPCAMQFDFIGKFETLEQDVQFLLSKLNESELIRLFSHQPKAKTTSSLWRETMNILSSQQLNYLKRMFYEDFRIFGYQY